MWQPLQPNLARPDEGIPASDLGPGAPETTDGLPTGGEEVGGPYRPRPPADGSEEDASAGDAGTGAAPGEDVAAEHADPPDDPPGELPWTGEPHGLDG